MEKHMPHCPAVASDYNEYCVCPVCACCQGPTTGRKCEGGADICEECWPHLVADAEDDETERQLMAGLDKLTSV